MNDIGTPFMTQQGAIFFLGLFFPWLPLPGTSAGLSPKTFPAKMISCKGPLIAEERISDDSDDRYIFDAFFGGTSCSCLPMGRLPGCFPDGLPGGFPLVSQFTFN